MTSPQFLHRATGLADAMELINLPDGAHAATFSRTHNPALGNLAGAASQRVMSTSIALVAGVTYSTATMWSGTTAAVTPTNQLMGLWNNDVTPDLVAVSTNKTTTAWAANSASTFTFTTPYVATYTGFYWIGYFMQAATPISLLGLTASIVSNTGPPVRTGLNDTGRTTTMPNPLSAPTVTSGVPWMWLA